MSRIAPNILFAVIVTPIFAHEGSHTGGDGVDAEPSKVQITVEDGVRRVEGNGLPDHEHGQFPNRRNPHTIAAQRYSFEMPAEPQPLRQPVEGRGYLFGVAVNGVVFDPGTAEFWRGDGRWNYEAMTGGIDLGVDESHAHVQPGGQYHYHGIPTGLIDKLGGNRDQMVLIGYAADGFPVYAPNCPQDANDLDSQLVRMQSSYRVKQGTRSSGPRGRYDGTFTADWEYVEGSGDLDECNGRTGVTPEYPDGTYYYVLTDEFPFIPRLFRGEPDASFRKHQGRPPGGGPPGRRPPGGRRPPSRR